MENSRESPVFQQDENVDPNVLHAKSEPAESQKGEVVTPKKQENLNNSSVQSPPSTEGRGRTDITLLMDGLCINEESENGSSPLAENVFLKSDSNDVSMSSHHDTFYSFRSSDNDDSVAEQAVDSQNPEGENIQNISEGKDVGNSSIVSEGSDSTVVSDATVEHVSLEHSFSNNDPAAENSTLDEGQQLVPNATEGTQFNSEAVVESVDNIHAQTVEATEGTRYNSEAEAAAKSIDNVHALTTKATEDTQSNSEAAAESIDSVHASTAMVTEDTRSNSEAEVSAENVSHIHSSPLESTTVCDEVMKNSKVENLDGSFEILSEMDLAANIIDANFEVGGQSCTDENYVVVESLEAILEKATLCEIEASNMSEDSEKTSGITNESNDLSEKIERVPSISGADKEVEAFPTADATFLNASLKIDDCQSMNFEENATSQFISRSANLSSLSSKTDEDTSKQDVPPPINEAASTNVKNECNIPAVVVKRTSLDKSFHSPSQPNLKVEDNSITNGLDISLKKSEDLKSAELILESKFDFPASIDLSGSFAMTPSSPKKGINNPNEDSETPNFKFSDPVPVVEDTSAFELQESDDMNLVESHFKMPEEGQMDFSDVEPIEMDMEQFGNSAAIEFPMQDEQLEQQADDEFFRMPEPAFLSSADEGEFKVPNPVKFKSSKAVDLRSPADINFEHSESKVPEVKLSEIPEFKLPESGLSEFPSENNFGSDGFKDEEFQDAAQFFEDPSSFTFLESIATGQSGPSLPRSSLYVNFDPLHSGQQQTKQQILHALSAPFPSDCAKSPEVSNNLAVRDSMGLISFASPNVGAPDVVFAAPTPSKVYTEEEFQQALKNQELALQEMHLKQQREQELESTQKLKSLSDICSVLRFTLGDLAEVTKSLKSENTELTKSRDRLKGMHLVLEKDCTTATEDLQKVESTFSDLHARYERCKALLQTYKENEAELKRRLEGADAHLADQQALHGALQKRMQEQLDAVAEECASAKRSGEAQATVLGAQLKKAELKISSLENDVRQQKTENKKLGAIIDELMEKVGKA